MERTVAKLIQPTEKMKVQFRRSVPSYITYISILHSFNLCGIFDRFRQCYGRVLQQQISLFVRKL